MYVHSVQKLKEYIQWETANISRKEQYYEMKYCQPQYRATLTQPTRESVKRNFLQGVPLATEPSMKILQRNMNMSTFVAWEMKRNVSVACVCSAPNCCDTEQRSTSNILISGKIIKEMPGSVASGTHCISYYFNIKLPDNGNPPASHHLPQTLVEHTCP